MEIDSSQKPESVSRLRNYAAWLVAALVTIVTSNVSAIETRFMQGLGDTHYKMMNSEVVGRSYHIFVSLPDGYEQSGGERYPTVYLLDGGLLFPLLSAYDWYLTAEDMYPDVIIVGISYGARDLEGGNYRSTDYTAASTERDYWGGAERFRSFLADELLPYIEDTYRSDADRRVIFGQSLGGQFVLFTALTRPRLFWGHIASNPALHRNLPFFLRSHANETSSDKQSKLFVGSGSNDVPMFRGPALEWIDYWSGRNNNPWDLKTMILDGHSHFSAPPAAYRQGMGWLFSTEQ